MFHTTIDSIVESELNFRPTAQEVLSDAILSLIPNEESRCLLRSISPYGSKTALLALAKDLADGKIDFSICIHSIQKQEQKQQTALIPAELLSSTLIQELAPYFSKLFFRSQATDGLDYALHYASDLLICPYCRKKLSLSTKGSGDYSFLCSNNHNFPIKDGVA